MFSQFAIYKVLLYHVLLIIINIYGIISKKKGTARVCLRAAKRALVLGSARQLE
jgi:hypothetical protein